MIRMIFRANMQPANVQATEKTEAQPSATTQSQNAEPNITPTPAANSVNTWQRAGLIQDGSIKQSFLNHELATEQSYARAQEQANKAKEAREENINGSLFGTIFGGLLVGTAIGTAIEDKPNNSEAKRDNLQNQIEQKQEEIKRLQSELKQAKDSSAWDTFGDWLTGSDGGASEKAQGADPLRGIAEHLTPKINDPD